MARKVFCACGQALAVPDNYPKPVARCSACGGTVQIPPLPGAPAPTAPVESPYGAPASSPYGAPANSYGIPPKSSTYGEPAYGQAPPRQVSNDSRVLYVILGFVGVAVVLFCGCGGILYFAMSGTDNNGQAARPKPVPPPIVQPNFPQPNFPPPTIPNSALPLSWQRHTSNAGWFECDLPGSPRYQNSVVDGVTENKVVANTPMGEFSVRYCSANELEGKAGARSPVDAMFRRAWTREHTDGRRNSPAGAGGDGQELTINNNGRGYRGKFLVRQGRIYELAWNGAVGGPDQSAWFRFANSFNFRADLAGPAPPPSVAPSPAVPPPPSITPTVPPPGTPASAPAPDEFAKRRIYIPIKFKRQSIDFLRKSMDKFPGNARLIEATQKNIDRMQSELEREIDAAARSNNLTREEVEAILREGEQKQW